MTPHVLRYKVEWTGFIGAPGYTNLFFNNTGDFFIQADRDEPVAKIQTWLAAWRSRLPSSVTIGLNSTVETVRASDGALTDFNTVTVAAPAPGTGTGVYSGASGACVNWYTDGIRNARRVRGRTFMVPVAGNFLSGDGTLDNTNLTAVRTANADLITPTAGGTQLYVWARPTPIKDANGVPTGEYNADGTSFPVSMSTISDKVAVLRSRRD